MSGKYIRSIFNTCSVFFIEYQGPFDVTKKLFTGGAEADKMTIHDKTDLFFNDYSFVPLFVQENYLLSQPWEAR